MFVNYNSYDFNLWFIALERIKVITVWVKLVCISSSLCPGQYGCVTLVHNALAGTDINLIIIVLGAMIGTVINLIIMVAVATITISSTAIISCTCGLIPTTSTSTLIIVAAATMNIS